MAIEATDTLNLKVDKATWDLSVVSGQLELASGQEGVAQAFSTRVKMYKGEWEFDLEAGIDYFGEVLVKNPDLPRIKSKMRQAILDCPGVKNSAAIRDVILTLDKATRTLNMTVNFYTQFGTLANVVESITI